MIDRTLGAYHLQALLGAGGMGEVYRARDMTLGRDVAIKILPAAFISDADRLARFEREARMLASLNHPNVCAIYGLEAADGIRFLILELVEGETLAERLAHGSGLEAHGDSGLGAQGLLGKPKPLALSQKPTAGLPVGEALAVARQIADALEAAHERGIIHRDLKPANIKITPEGTVKVLDFGLAKAAIGDGSGPDLTQSPTITMRGTLEGVILGTAAYMSPEQARGKSVDRRADVWAFGVVFFEMLTGQPLFTGETVTDIIAAVVTHEPDWAALPAETPPSVLRLLRRCLEKDPKQRLRDIGDARLEINDASMTAATAGRTSSSPSQSPDSIRSGLRTAGWRRALPWAVAVAAAVCLVAAVAVAFVHFREVPAAPERTVRFEIRPPDKSAITNFDVSPDGRYLAFVANEGGGSRLWVRPLDSLTAQALPGTDGAQGIPFWSPDSASIGFFSQRQLKRVSVTGGPPETLSDIGQGPVLSGTWNREGIVVFGGRAATPLQRVPAAGGVPLALGGQPAPGERHSFPHFLPDGRRFLYTNTGGKPEVTGIYVGSLDGVPPVRILPDPSLATYAPPVSSGGIGHLLFRRENTLMAQPFDPDNVRMTAEMFPVAQSVGNVAASENGVLAYQAPITGIQQLIWVDRTGKQVASAGPAGVYNDIRLAPDEKRIVFDRPESANATPDIWVLDIVRGVTTRLTLDPAVDNLPIWSFDGSRVLFPSSRAGGFDLYIEAATHVGQEELLIKMDTPNGWGTDWSLDGRFIVYQRPGVNARQDLWIAPQSGDRKPFPYLQGPFSEQNGMFSPDGRWIAYVSDETGRNEVYVQAFPLSGEKQQISTGGGSDANWRRDGGELFYLAADRQLMGVPYTVGRAASGPTFEPGVTTSLFPVPGNLVLRSYAVAGDGRRFLLSKPVGDATAIPITVVLNWPATFKR